MNNYVYHGSIKNDLKEIEPHYSTHKQEWVYATKSKCLATIFINKSGGDLSYFLGGNGSKDCPIILVERLPHTFEKIFNRSGSLYTLDASSFKEGLTSWSTEVVAEGKQMVISEEKIDNVFDKLKEYNDNGELKLYLYPERPSYIPLDNSDLIEQYITYHNEGLEYSIEGLLKYYPEFTDIVQQKLNPEQIIRK